MQLYVFGYGSLMNPKSVARTLSPRQTSKDTLIGYQRKVNVPHGDFLYMNIVPRPDSHVDGVLIPITEAELDALKIREIGYTCTDVSEQFTHLSGHVFTFIAPNTGYPLEYRVPRSYINTCLGGVEPALHEIWLAETIIENPIEEDAANPVYENTPVE